MIDRDADAQAEALELTVVDADRDVASDAVELAAPVVLGEKVTTQ